MSCCNNSTCTSEKYIEADRQIDGIQFPAGVSILSLPLASTRVLTAVGSKSPLFNRRRDPYSGVQVDIA
jgi:hypothetical protein